jgi:hypothetical protein
MTDRLRSGWGRAAHPASLGEFQVMRDLLFLYVKKKYKKICIER